MYVRSYYIILHVYVHSVRTLCKAVKCVRTPCHTQTHYITHMILMSSVYVHTLTHSYSVRVHKLDKLMSSKIEHMFVPGCHVELIHKTVKRHRLTQD